MSNRKYNLHSIANSINLNIDKIENKDIYFICNGNTIYFCGNGGSALAAFDMAKILKIKTIGMTGSNNNMKDHCDLIIKVPQMILLEYKNLTY